MLSPRWAARIRVRRRSLSGALAGVLCALGVLAGGAAAQPFALALEDPAFFGSRPVAQTDSAYQSLKTVGGSVVRVLVNWSITAPIGPTQPAGFDASDPADRHYFWTVLDETVRRAAQHHAHVLLEVLRAPLWAEGPGIPTSGTPFAATFPGDWEPNAGMLGQFVHALAERYGGQFADPVHAGASLPRVKDYEIWNEPNLWRYLAGPNTADQYRNLLNAGYAAIKAVHKDNVAVFGGLAPISNQLQYSTHPLTFAAQLMCLRQVGTHFVRVPGHCQKAQFDVMGVHPYTLAATPTKPAYNHDDILTPDTWKLRNLLHTAERLHTISSGSHPLWVTEWSWWTNPPNPQYGDSPATAARYVAYSMYEMWSAGVSLISWQLLADGPAGGFAPGGGLETSTGAAKPDMQAFAFPFVAKVNGRHGYAWGRVPVQRRVKVTVEVRSGTRWHRVARVRTDRSGIFTATFSAHGNRTYRARAPHGDTSLPYFSAKIPPQRTHAFSFG